MNHVVLRGMSARGFGRVVNIASDAGRVGSSGEAVYSACKGGIIAFTKTVARELVGKGVILNTICPGPTDTAILRSFLEGPDGTRIAEGLKRAIPMRRLGVPEDYPGPARLPAVGRRRLHHRPDHQRLRRPHHARITALHVIAALDVAISPVAATPRGHGSRASCPREDTAARLCPLPLP